MIAGNPLDNSTDAGGQTPVDDQRFPASSAQEFMWLAVQLVRSEPSYHVPYRVAFDGELDIAALRSALHDIVARHEILRTTFQHDGTRLWQVVHPRGAPEVEVIEPDGPEQAERVAARWVAEPFDLTGRPPLRAGLLRLGPHRHELVIVLHHMIFDGWSAGVLFRELATAYNARLAGGRPQFAPLEIQFADFAHWQNEWLAGPEVPPLLAFWRRQLDGTAHILRLPTGEAGEHDAVHRMALPADLDRAVRELARAQRCTLFVVMLAAYAVLLQRHSGQDDIVIGSSAANRPRPETAGLIGMFVNVLPLRADMTGAPSYRELLARVRQTTLDGFDHQLPTETIITDLRPVREAGRGPLFQAVFWLQPGGAPQAPFDGLHTEVEELFNGAAKYDLALGVREAPQGMSFELSYRAAMLGPRIVARMADDYVAILREMVADPERRAVEPAESTVDEAAAVALPGTAAPGTATEKTIAGVWCAVLDVESVGLHDNFFDLGGHSLLMIQVRQRLSEAFGRELSMLDLFDYPTVSTLAAFIGGGRDETGGTLDGAGALAEQQRAGRLRLMQAKGRPND